MDAEIKELLQRVTSLETKLDWILSLIPWVGGALLTLFALFFGLQLTGIRSWINKKLRTTAIGQAERKAEKAATQIESKRDSIEAAVREAEARLETFRRLLSDIDDVATARFRTVETGSFEVTFAASDYCSGRVAFAKRFSFPPVVLLGEHQAGNWVFLKIDEVTPEYFKWAAKPLLGEKVKYKTDVAWAALSVEVSNKESSQEP